ncbi:MAG: hypothetical protein Q9192_007335, partial [Flavoplaca navasiana]
EALPIWNTYSHTKPEPDTTESWTDHIVSNFTQLLNKRAAHVSTISKSAAPPELQDFTLFTYSRIGAKLAVCEAALRIAPFLVGLEQYEAWLFIHKSEIEVLKAKIDRDEECSQLLQSEFAEARDLLAAYELCVTAYAELVVEQGKILGLISCPSSEPE